MVAGGLTTGDIRVNGYPKVQATFARICGYVEQNDIHSPQVTVGESLMFSAQLRLMDVKKHDITLFVNEVSVPASALLHALSNFTSERFSLLFTTEEELLCILGR